MTQNSPKVLSNVTEEKVNIRVKIENGPAPEFVFQ